MPAPARRRTATLARPASESRPILAAVLAIAALFLLVAMGFHQSSDANMLPDFLERALTLPDDSGAKVTDNPCGSFGATLAIVVFSLFGYAGFLVPFFIGAAGWFALNQRAHTLWPFKVLLMALCVLLLAPILALWLEPDGATRVSSAAFDPKGSGGLVGGFLHGTVFAPLLGPYGSWFLILPYGFALMGALADDPRATLASWIAETRDAFGAWNASRREAAARAAELARRRAAEAAELRRKQASVQGAVVPPAAVVSPVLTPPESAPPPETKPAEEEQPEIETVDPENVTVSSPQDESAEEKSPAKVRATKPKKPETEDEDDEEDEEEEEEAVVDGGKVLVVKPEKIERAAKAQIPKRQGDYVFPDVSLLAAASASSDAPAEDFRRRAGELIETLKQFNVNCVPVDSANGVDVGIQQGPSITRYEIKPAPGTRVEKVANLSNNIAMNLEAESVRILAPVPGKGTVGIEIPNRVRKDVRLREILESKAWAESKMEIPVVLGVDSVTNKPVIQDLARMPHCLIAGSTGQGKSVCINAFIVSLLYRRTPEDLRFIMVDPKVVELQVYQKLPHLLIPVETDPKRVPAALKWLIAEMMRRYKIFAKVGVRNVTSFNAKLAADAAAPKQEELRLTPEEQAAAAAAAESAVDDGVKVPTEKLPYIVCVIDEMADLMMVAADEVEKSVARLAQLARAAGIHLVLATQRPSTDVITGLIKANLPTRIAFKVSALVDSRTILDSRGAETLVGRGDMLFIPPGSATLQRVQGAFVGEQEVEAIVGFLNQKNGGPEFVQEVVEAIESGAEGGGEGGDGEEGEDPLVMQCWAIIRETRRASVSMLQRRLKLGYNRAARIMDILHEKGYVGPENGSSPREILVE